MTRNLVILDSTGSIEHRPLEVYDNIGVRILGLSAAGNKDN